MRRPPPRPRPKPAPSPHPVPPVPPVVTGQSVTDTFGGALNLHAQQLTSLLADTGSASSNHHRTLPFFFSSGGQLQFTANESEFLVAACVNANGNMAVAQSNLPYATLTSGADGLRPVLLWCFGSVGPISGIRIPLIHGGQYYVTTGLSVTTIGFIVIETHVG